MNGAFDFKAGGSPLESRTNPIIYIALVVAVIVIAVFAVIWFIMRYIKKLEENPTWIANEKARPTKYKDIKKLSKFYTFKNDEIALLWYICKKYAVPNIYYAIKEFNDINPIFKQAYQDFKIERNEQKINRLFLLKFKLDKYFMESISLSSSTSIGKDTKFTISFQDGHSVKGSLLENTKDYFLVSLPDTFLHQTEKPEPLSKVAVSFVAKNDVSYIFVTRIIRYQKINGRDYMALAHSNQLIKKTQRSFKRIQLNEKCRYASVTKEQMKGGKTMYIPGDKKTDATLTNISGGGCCISSKLPIKEGQYIYTEFDLKDGAYSAIGRIVRTRKDINTGEYNLHIHFEDIYLETQNKILAKVYNYD